MKGCARIQQVWRCLRAHTRAAHHTSSAKNGVKRAYLRQNGSGIKLLIHKMYGGPRKPEYKIVFVQECLCVPACMCANVSNTILSSFPRVKPLERHTPVSHAVPSLTRFRTWLSSREKDVLQQLQDKSMRCNTAMCLQASGPDDHYIILPLVMTASSHTSPCSTSNTRIQSR